jgi:hypothetical protein
VIADEGWHVGSPQQRIQTTPTRKSAYASTAAIIMVSCEHRVNDRAFPQCVTNLHDRARSSKP